MQSNIFDSMILGTISNGQGSIVVVTGLHRAAALRKWATKHARALFASLGRWYALQLQRMPVAMTPALATCRVSTTRCDQRRERWMSGVVVDPGIVGVC